MSDAPILVTGGTGAQGGAVIDALLAREAPVRALVRDPASAGARGLAERGVSLVTGDFDDAASLAAAVAGVAGVFSMQNPPRLPDRDAELRAGRKLIEAARKAGVETFVHTSVARAGDQSRFEGWAEGLWWRDYWDSKSGVNAMVREAGFPHWVILKPAYMMDNFTAPKAHWMYPTLETRGEILTAMASDTRLDLIAAADIGLFAATAFLDPTRFHGQDIDLAAEALTMGEIAQTIGQASGKPVQVRHVTAAEGERQGYSAGLMRSEQWCNVEGYKVDLAKARGHGLALTSFAAFARRHARAFLIGHP